MATRPSGTGVIVKDYENINQALKRFKRKVEEAKILDILRRREFYEPPSMVRKREKAAARSRWMKSLAKEAAQLLEKHKNRK